MTNLHEKAERLIGYLETELDLEAAETLRALSARLAEVERERDARVAHAYEEAAQEAVSWQADVDPPENEYELGQKQMAASIAQGIRALVRHEETDALDRIRAEVWDEVAVLCNQNYGGSIGDIHKAAVMRAAAIREDKT